MLKIAYLILAHNDCKQLVRTITALDYKCDFYIHIDLKSNIKEFNELKKFDNVYFVDRIKTNWAGFNIVIATKNLIKKALDNKQQYSHLVLLSGADYPIKSNVYIYNYFCKNRNVEFIRGFEIENSSDHYRKQISKMFFNDIYLFNTKISKVFIKASNLLMYPIRKKTCIILKNNKVIKPCFGSQWWALTPECCKYIIRFCEENKEIDDYFKYSFSPDEKFFHTIVFNSKFKNNTLNKGVEKYKKRGTYLLANCHIISPSLSKWYNADDYDYIMKSDKLFVRKVNSDKSTKLLDLLDSVNKEN